MERNVTENGKIFKMEKQELIFESCFYLSDKIIEHSVHIFIITELFSSIGGFLAFMISLCGILCSVVNERLFLSNLAESMYYVKIKNQEKLSKGLKKNLESKDNKNTLYDYDMMKFSW